MFLDFPLTKMGIADTRYKTIVFSPVGCDARESGSLPMIDMKYFVFLPFNGMMNEGEHAILQFLRP
jgi:hypothetical protein